MSLIMSLLGIFGAFLMVLMYAMLERGKITAQNASYYAVNGIGAFLITVSLAYDFDWADLGGIGVEVCWVIISAMGLWRLCKTSFQKK